MKRNEGSTMLAALCVAALALILALLGRVLLVSRDSAIENGAEASSPSDSLGMVLIDIRDDEDASFYHVDDPGVYVLAVRERTSAQAAGVRTGDRLVALNGQSVATSAQLNEMLDALAQNATLTLTLQRAGESAELRLTLRVDANESG